MSKTDIFVNMGPEKTLSYQYINEEVSIDQDFSYSNIINCNINNSIFEDVDFTSANFDGSYFVDCKFTSSKWPRTDCCSLIVTNCLFNNIDFTLSTMRNCDFKHCAFIQCSFDHIALSGSNFVDCQFININLPHSSTYLNTYMHCKFEECAISSNFYYNLMLDNQYIKTVFHNKLVSYNYFFLNGKQLFDLGFGDDEKEELKKYLTTYNLLLNLVILELNETNDVDIALIRFIIAIRKLLEINVSIREEQLQFIENLLQYLLETKKISAVTIGETLCHVQSLIDYFETNSNDPYLKCKNTLNLIKNTLYFAYQEIGQNTTYLFDSNMQDTEHVVKIVYDTKPQIPICDIINEIKNALGIKSPDATQIKTESGSFHEWITCYDSVLGCLQLFIGVLGLGYTIIRNHQNEKNKIYELPEIKPDNNSTQIVEVLKKVLNKQKITPEFDQTIQIIVKNDIIASKKFRGYSKSNIYSIDIIAKNS